MMSNSDFSAMARAVRPAGEYSLVRHCESRFGPFRQQISPCPFLNHFRGREFLPTPRWPAKDHDVFLFIFNILSR
jgi:hypothetical protein